MSSHSKDGQIENLVASINPARNHVFLWGESPAMRALHRTVADVAPTDIPILLFGESGTGKEMIALEIHRLSGRRDAPFVKYGCAGLKMESLMGLMNYGKSEAGNEAAALGSLFLDEVSRLDAENQARLHHLLPDSAAFLPEYGFPVRLISSTSRNLAEEMRQGRFLQELYYRINGVYLQVPPLRQRKEDIPALLYFFLNRYASLFERPEPRLSSAAMDRFLRHFWPGNVRELENVARKIVALGNEERAITDLGEDGLRSAGDRVALGGAGEGPPSGISLKEVAREASRHAERELILKQLERTRWNRKKAARELQISYKALLYKLKQLGLDGSAGSDRH